MRSLFLALLLTLAFAGGAQAQEQVRTGRVTPSAQTQPRAVPSRMVQQTRSTAGRAKAAPAARASVQQSGSRRSPSRQPKRPAPRG